MSKAREFWVFKGDSNFCQEMEYDLDTDTDRKSKPCGFYDIVSTKDTVEGGIHVREVRPGEITLTRKELRAAMERALVLEPDATDLERTLFGEAKDE